MSKNDLQSAPALATVDKQAPCALQVHASEIAISAVLLQKQGEDWRYFSC